MYLTIKNCCIFASSKGKSRQCAGQNDPETERIININKFNNKN